MLAGCSYPKNLSVIPGRNIKSASFVERQRPYVLRLRIKKNGGLPFACARRRCARFLPGTRVSAICRRAASGATSLDLVNFAIWIGRRIQHAVFIHHQRLHLQFLRLENGDWLYPCRDPIHSRRRSRRRIDFSIRPDCRRPHRARRRAGQQLELRRQFQVPNARNRHSMRSAFYEILVFGLLPRARPLGK